MAADPEAVRQAALVEMAKRELAKRQQPGFYGRANTAIQRNPLGPLMALPEVGLNLATGALGGIVGEAAATGVAAYNQGNRDQSLTPDSVANRVAGALTYQPRSEMGRAAVAGIQKAATPIGQMIEKVANPTHTGTEFGEHAIKLATAFLPIDRLARAPGVALRHPAIEQAIRGGFKLDPSQIIEGAPVGSLVQRTARSPGGKAAVPAQASLDNQPRVQQLVSEEFGLPGNEYLTKATIDKQIRAPANAAYSALESLKNTNGRPLNVNLARDGQYLGSLRKLQQTATEGVTGVLDSSVAKIAQRFLRPKQGATVADLMKDVRQLRSDASKNFLSEDPKANAQARVQRGIADALEDALDRQVGPRNPQVIAKWREARKTLAKLHTVEDAMVGTEIDGRLIAKARAHGAPLTGNLALIADVADNFPRVMQTGADLGSKASQGVLDAALGLPTFGLWNLGRLGAKNIALGAGEGVLRASRPIVGAAIAEGQQSGREKP